MPSSNTTTLPEYLSATRCSQEPMDPTPHHMSKPRSETSKSTETTRNTAKSPLATPQQISANCGPCSKTTSPAETTNPSTPSSSASMLTNGVGNPTTKPLGTACSNKTPRGTTSPFSSLRPDVGNLPRGSSTTRAVSLGLTCRILGLGPSSTNGSRKPMIMDLFPMVLPWILHPTPTLWKDTPDQEPLPPSLPISATSKTNGPLSRQRV